MTTCTTDNSAAPPLAATRRILVVDDDAATNSALQFVLRHAGYEVLSAPDGRACLAELERCRCDLVLLDVQMPVLDGVQTLALLRRDPRHKHTPVVMLTKHVSNELMNQCQALGANGFLGKQQLSGAALQQVIRQALAPRAAARDMPDNFHLPVEQRVVKSEQLAQRMANTAVHQREETLALAQAVRLPLLFGSLRAELRFAPDPAPASLSRLVLQDPGLVIGVLQSAPTPTPRLCDALAQLPPDQIQHLADDAAGGRISAELRPWVIHWWRHTLATGLLAEALAPSLELDPQRALVAGLLHDVGRLVLLLSELSEEAREAYDLARHLVLPTQRCEQALFGIDHRELGEQYLLHHQVHPQLARACVLHDLEAAQRAQLEAEDARLSALLHACNTIAKSVGFGSLPNDELTPLPHNLVDVVAREHVVIERVLAEAQTICRWRAGAKTPPTHPRPAELTGVSVLFLAPDTGPFNPYRKALVRAGGHVTIYADPHAAVQHLLRPDVLVFDQTQGFSPLALPHLQQLRRQFADVPLLVLGRRSDDPEDLASQFTQPVQVYATPIRSNTLLQAIRRLRPSNCSGDEAS